MIIMLAIDDMGGMMFNKRRVSQDRALRGRILERAENGKLWMNSYSAKQFSEAERGLITVDESFLAKAAPEDFCFVEDADITPFVADIRKLILYRWNRRYPSDFRLTLDTSSWTLAETHDFPGYSHEKITEEVYVP